MPVFNRYEYEPLTAVCAMRLAVLNPVTDYKDPLSCQIIQAQYSNQEIQYSAISYVWGRHEFTRTLEINCDEDVKYLRITPNLDSLLRGLRSRTKRRYLWVDFVCLNQNDAEEKARQIPEMGNIYRNASTVDIWLGSEEGNTKRLFSFFHKLSRVPDVTKWKRQWDMARRIVDLAMETFDGQVREAFEATASFFWRAWFTRRWIIQEACLAGNAIVHCGSQSIPLDVLTVAATRFQQMDVSDYGIKVAGNLGHKASKFPMLELLWLFHGATCLDPKDRIASLSSLGCDAQLFRLDYTKHWTEIYRDFAYSAYDLGDNDARLQLLLHLFEFGPVLESDDPAYPSWVPNWSRPRRRRLPYNSRTKDFDTYETYICSPGEFEKATVSLQDQALCIDWNISGRSLRDYQVAFASTMGQSQKTQERAADEVADALERLFPVVSEAKMNILALAALLETIAEFRHPVNKGEQTSRPLGQFEEDLLRSHPDLKLSELLTWLRTLDSVMQEYCLVELHLPGDHSGRARGYGISPEVIQAGDVVLPLWGLGNGIAGNIWERERSLQLSTMLAVRPIEQQDSGGLSKDSYIPSGRVVGPVTCITIQETPDIEWSLRGILVGLLQTEPGSSMRLL